MGVIYYKLPKGEGYPGDTTKGCGLTGKEIDSNFHFLRGYDINNAAIDEENGTLVISRVNGNDIVIENFGEYISTFAFSGATYDIENGILTIYSNNDEFSISGFTTPNDIKTISDEITVFGDGTAENPIRTNISSKTGVYSPAELIEDIDERTDINTRYLLREEVAPCETGETEWRYFIYEYYEPKNEWTSTELLPGERIILKEYLEQPNAEVICIPSDEGSTLKIYNKDIIAKNALKIAENDTKKEIRLIIPNDEKVLSQGENGLFTTISLTYDKPNAKILLKGINDTIISSVDVSDFVNYKFGKGLTESGHTVDVKISENSEDFLTFDDDNGIKISGVTNAINSAVTPVKEELDATATITAETYSKAEEIENLRLGRIVYVTNDETISGQTYVSGAYIYTQDGFKKLDIAPPSSGESLEERVQKLENRTGKQEVEISDLSSKTETLSTTLNELSGSTKNIQDDLSSLSEKVENDFDEVNNEINELSGQVVEHKEEIEELKEKIGEGGFITSDITISGETGEIVIAHSGETTTEALQDVATYISVSGGTGDGKVKDVEINGMSVLDEETGIANIILNGDADISVDTGDSKTVITLLGISNEAVELQ